MLAETAQKIINRINASGQLGAYMGGTTSKGNFLVRFDIPDIPTILVADHYLNEERIYKYNICKRVKHYLVEEIEIGVLIYYYPIEQWEKLCANMMKYKIYKK